MERLTGIPANQSDKLYEMLMRDKNFKYDISEGGFYTDDGVIVGIDRAPYQCMVYAANQAGEKNVTKWHNYIMDKWNDMQNN